MTAAPEGTFVPIEGSPGWYEVCLGRGTYAVNAATGACTCPRYEYQLAYRPGSLCRHGVALAQYLRHEKECPLCEGQGTLALRGDYADSTPILCIVCGGSGLK